MDYRPQIRDRFFKIMDYVLALKVNGIEHDKDFMEALGVPQQYKAAYKSGAKTPTVNVIIELNKVFGVSLDYMLLGEGRMIQKSKIKSSTTDAEHILKKIAKLTKDYQ